MGKNFDGQETFDSGDQAGVEWIGFLRLSRASRECVRRLFRNASGSNYDALRVAVLDTFGVVLARYRDAQGDQPGHGVR